MNAYGKSLVEKRAALPTFIVLALFSLVINSGIAPQAHGAALVESPEEVKEAHYNLCKNRLGPQLTREQAANLNGDCQEIVQKPLSPEEEDQNKRRLYRDILNPVSK